MTGARRSAPEGALVGQAAVTGDKDNGAKNAEAEAKYQLARAMSFMVKDMVDAAVAEGIIPAGPAEEFRQAVNSALTKNTMTAAQSLGQGAGAKNVYWAVVCMDKADVFALINQLVTTAKPQFPPVTAFSTANRIDKAYEAQAAKEWKKTS